MLVNDSWLTFASEYLGLLEARRILFIDCKNILKLLNERISSKM